jgi:hypothetical protein
VARALVLVAAAGAVGAACFGGAEVISEPVPPAQEPPAAKAASVLSPSSGGAALGGKLYQARIVVGAPTPAGAAGGLRLGAGHAQHGQLVAGGIEP